MSILLGIAALFGIVFAMFAGAAGKEFSPGRHPRITLRSRPDATQPGAKVQLLIEGSGFEPDSQLQFIAWHLPDGHGSHHRDPVISARPYAYRSSSFDDVAFEPPITIAAHTPESEPHDIKVIATDSQGNSAEAWISGKDFYLREETGVVR